MLELIAKAATSNRLNLRGANLDGCNLRGLSLRGADLRSAGLKEANLEGTDLAQARFDGVSWTYSYSLRDIEETLERPLERPKAKGVSMGPGYDMLCDDFGLGFTCDKVKIDGASLVGANLRGANLEGACLAGACLRKANLQGANLKGADLRLACLSNANLTGVDLTKTKLSGSCFERADLQAVNMAGVNLSTGRNELLYLGDGEIETGPASLQHARLKRANLKRSCLLGVYLDFAHLEGACFEGAEMGSVRVGNDRYDRATSLHGADGLTWQQLETANLKSSYIDIACGDDYHGRTQFIKDFFHAVNGYTRCGDYEYALLIVDMFYKSFTELTNKEIIDAIASIFDYKIALLRRLNRFADATKVEKTKKDFPERLKNAELFYWRTSK